MSAPAADAFPIAPGVEVAVDSARERWAVRWILMLVLVYAASAVVTVRPVTDPDIWWQLRTGQWIVDHRTVPSTDPFSTYGSSQRWVAYSWLFDVAIYALHNALGFMGLTLYTVIGGLAVTSSLLVLVMRFEYRVPRAIAITALGIAAMAPVLMPRAYLFTVCFFIVEIYVLLDARETGRRCWLWLLPPLFAVWANLHIQFVYGLGVIALACVESFIALLRRGEQAAPSVPFRPVILTAIASALATLATPYGINIYRPVIEVAGQRGVYDMIIELGAPAFRQPANWVFLALALAGAFSLGRHRRLPLFPALLLASCAYFSFSSRRDMWFVAVAGVVAIVMTWGERRRPRPALRRGDVVLVAIGVIAAVGVLAASRHVSETTIQTTVAATYPEAAVAVVRERGYPGPLFNTYDWGGFLIWRLPEHRVSMDGRSNIYGDERIWRSVQTAAGVKAWDANEELRSASLIILPVEIPLTELLRRDDRYELVYEDGVAAVFTRHL
jgi:hypothetical protein